MRDPWFQAFFCLPPTICGVQLLPYSIAHDYILSNIDSPYSDPKNCKPNEIDLFEAIQVCGRTWEDNRDYFVGGHQADLIGPLARWANKWRKKMDLQMAHDNFVQYIDEYTYVATHRTPAPKPDMPDVQVSAPYHWHLVGVLMSQFNMSESQAWNNAYNSSKCLFDCYTESQGDDTLESLHDMRNNELCAEAKALYDAGDLEGMQAKYQEVQDRCNLRNRILKGLK